MMRITQRMVADSINFNLQKGLKRLEHYANQLSTGKAFQRPSQNPVGVGRVMGYSAAVNRNEQYRLNMNESRGWLESTEGNLYQALQVLQRVRELSIYGASEGLSPEDRRAIAPEVFEMMDYLVGISNTETNGLYIFGGHQTLSLPFIRENLYRVSVDGGSGIVREGLEAEGLQNGQYRLEVETADQGTLLVMLYNGSINFLRRGREAMRSRDVEEANFCLGRVQDILCELMGSLNQEDAAEMSARLFAIYEFMYNRLVQANIKQDQSLLDEVEGIFVSLLEAWQAALRQGPQEE